MKKSKKRKRSLLLLKSYYIQIHLTVVYEAEFITKWKSEHALNKHRDEILDGINRERRRLGYLT